MTAALGVLADFTARRVEGAIAANGRPASRGWLPDYADSVRGTGARAPSATPVP
jgi:hypothetical protein